MIKIKHSQCSEARHAHWCALLTIMLPAAVQLKMVGKTHKQTERLQYFKDVIKAVKNHHGPIHHLISSQ